jgi:hypothetical protein
VKKNKVLKHIRGLAKLYGVQLRVTSRTQGLSGYAYSERNKIFLNSYLGPKHTLSCFFHELQHVLNYRNKKYYAYHGGGSTKQVYRAIIYHGWQAERYTDRMAALLMKRHFPNEKYRAAYNNDWAKLHYKIAYQYKTLLDYKKRWKL